jgi:hypothetical protein
MLLLVPFGDELVPLLQMVTADITIALVHLSGIPPRSMACSSIRPPACSKWPRPVRV